MIVVKRSPGCISITGHAWYAPRGQDIVCAGVSTLVQNFVRSMEQLAIDSFEYDIADGNVVIQYGILSGHAQVLMKSFFIGIEMIAEAYPDYVRVI